MDANALFIQMQKLQNKYVEQRLFRKYLEPVVIDNVLDLRKLEEDVTFGC